MKNDGQPPPKPHLNPRELSFLSNYLSPNSPTFGNGTQSAIKAGYSRKTAAEQAYDLLRKPKIQQAIEEWKAKTEGDAIASITERKVILSEIARGDASDYLIAGKDGAGVEFGPGSKNRRAVASLKSRTDELGAGITEIRLRDPVPAIAELNEMDGRYQNKGEGTEGELRNVNIRIVLGGEKKDCKSMQASSGNRKEPQNDG